MEALIGSGVLRCRLELFRGTERSTFIFTIGPLGFGKTCLEITWRRTKDYPFTLGPPGPIGLRGVCQLPHRPNVGLRPTAVMAIRQRASVPRLAQVKFRGRPPMAARESGDKNVARGLWLRRQRMLRRGIRARTPGYPGSHSAANRRNVPAAKRRSQKGSCRPGSRQAGWAAEPRGPAAAGGGRKDAVSGCPATTRDWRTRWEGSRFQCRNPIR
jgi:hypothetical protein